MMPTMTSGDSFLEFPSSATVFLRKYTAPEAKRIRFSSVLDRQGYNPELGLDSFRSHPGLETEPLASFRLHGAKVPNQPGTRNSEQPSRLTLVAARSLINRSDMAPHSIGQ